MEKMAAALLALVVVVASSLAAASQPGVLEEENSYWQKWRPLVAGVGIENNDYQGPGGWMRCSLGVPVWKVERKVFYRPPLGLSTDSAGEIRPELFVVYDVYYGYLTAGICGDVGERILQPGDWVSNPQIGKIIEDGRIRDDGSVNENMKTDAAIILVESYRDERIVPPQNVTHDMLVSYDETYIDIFKIVDYARDWDQIAQYLWQYKTGAGTELQAAAKISDLLYIEPYGYVYELYAPNLGLPADLGAVVFYNETGRNATVLGIVVGGVNTTGDARWEYLYVAPIYLILQDHPGWKVYTAGS